MNKAKKISLYFLLFLSAIIIILFFTRLFSARQLDDVSPNIPCEEELLLKSDLLFVVPAFENNSIANNASWCEYILSLNKTLGMHGVYHTYLEFMEPRDEEYIRYGMEEFKKCFGFYPEIFEAPQVDIIKENKVLLQKMGFEVKDWENVVIHKVYHTQETGQFAIKFGIVSITNKLMDFI